MATSDISSEDKEWLLKCEEELKFRYTEKDIEFMKVFNAEPSTPPIVESWWVPQRSAYRNNYGNRSHHSYERYNRNNKRGYNDHRYNERSDNYNKRPHYD